MVVKEPQMKCPKCGYNSFEYYDSCKKCSNDLIAFKQIYSVTSLVLPFEAKEKMAAEFRLAESETAQSSNTVESHDDIFSFDLPGESTSQLTNSDDPFNFDEPATGADTVGVSKSDDDVFADLLESTSQVEESAFAAPQVSTHSSSAEKTVGSSESTGEFDLESFSWDDTPAATAETKGTETTDDFDSLFGDTKESAPK
jgi:hypothetical protein